MESTRNTCHAHDEEIEEKMQDNRSLRRDLVQNEQIDENGPRSLIMEIYPWILQFKKMCRSSLTQRSMSSLKTLMTFYLSNIRPSVNECRTKPLRAEKLKDSISEALLFFLYYYRDVGDLKDRDYYLIFMSDLLAMYIDMELKASKKGKEDCSKISSRLSSCLHVYLEHSTEHLLDTLLKVHFMNHNYSEILDPVITKVFKIIDDHPNSSIMYVRYFLVYRLWKKLNKDVAVRNKINLIAVTSLGIAPIDIPPFILQSVLPQVPKTQKFSTKLLLLQKFEVEKSCEEFLNFCNKERGLMTVNIEDNTCFKSTIVSLPEDNNDCRELINNNNNLSIITNNVASSKVNSSINEINVNNSIERPSVTRKAVSLNLSSSRKVRKSNDIVFIDLTSDTVTEKVIRSKKTRRKLSWLEKTKKRANTKINPMENSSIEDSKHPEDKVDLESLHISDPKSPSSKMDILVEIVNDDEITSTKNEEINENMETDNETSCTVTSSPDNKSPCNTEWRQLERFKNEKNRVEVEIVDEKKDDDICSSLVQLSSIQPEAITSESESHGVDQYSRNIEINDTGELPVSCDVGMPETLEKMSMANEDVKDKTLVEKNTPVCLAIKPEHVLVPPSSEIINEPVVSSATEAQIGEYVPEVSLNRAEEPRKIHEVEFQENIDGLSLLASVSQRISHLTTSNINATPVELIKVKNYASLANLNVAKEPNSLSNGIPFTADVNTDVINTNMDIYPEDAMEKVAYQVEITSSDVTELYQNCEQPTDLMNYSMNNEGRCNNQSQTAHESTNIVEKDDTNVILNGETVVLFQKSPNSNLYIINKAVENRDHVNDDVAEHIKDPTAAFTYDIYDSIYRNQASNYDITQYSRDLSSQDNRRGKMVKPEQTDNTSKGCDSLEISKSVKSNGFDVVDDKSRIKRKIMNSGLTRRRRIKQEYNGCASNISSHIKTSYGIQDCPQEHQDANRSIHIPVAHTNAISTMYTKYSSGAELYLPCHKNCNSITCGLTVNPSAGLHNHSGNNTTRNTHCSCLNCTYGIVPRCTECILPNGGARTTTMDPNAYYMPIHAGQKANVQDCNVTRADDKLANIYDDQLACNYEKNILESKTLDNVKYKPKENYRNEFDNKLPLKKRFKAIMAMSFVEEVPIKCEKLQSYPGTPMLSIAALEASQDDATKSPDVTRCTKTCPDSPSKVIGRGEMIRRDYHKDMMMSSPTAPVQLQNGHRNSSAKRKRGISNNCTERNDDDDKYAKIRKTMDIGETIVNDDVGCKRTANTPTKSQGKLSENVKNTELTMKKNSTRQTRSSKRNVPKVNYIYADGDSDWNPSGGFNDNALNKRKRKRTSR